MNLLPTLIAIPFFPWRCIDRLVQNIFVKPKILGEMVKAVSPFVVNQIAPRNHPFPLQCSPQLKQYSPTHLLQPQFQQATAGSCRHNRSAFSRNFFARASNSSTSFSNPQFGRIDMAISSRKPNMANPYFSLRACIVYSKAQDQ